MQYRKDCLSRRSQIRSVALGLVTTFMMMNAYAIEVVSTRYTKLDTDGNTWRASASNEPWSCVLDHRTGLTWEIKTHHPGLRAANHTYTAYPLEPMRSVAHCATQSCDAPSYIAAVNAAGLCGAQDWRLPEREELRSLVDYTRPSPGPTADTDFFPNTVANFYWSATPDVSDAHSTWGLGFAHGFDYAYPKENAAHLRLVRGNASPTEGNFTISDGNTVRDWKTGLIWQRCSVGQHWNGTRCTDNARPMSFMQAQHHAQQHHPWRLPTLTELINTVDLTHYSPAVNSTLFPNTVLRSYWTTTPLASNANLQWCVNFTYGDSYADDATASAYVRLVQDGTPDK